jgi:predicted DCC family thiol-disulfide oxidoreductase YuxK
MPAARDLPPYPIAVMDGTCALCCFGARMIDRLDQSGEIRICTVQSDLGARLLAEYGLRPDDPESWLFLDGGQAYEGFDAMVKVGRRTGGWGRLLGVLRILPPPLRRWLYARIARNRYAVFGRADMCAIPSPSLRARLIV